MLFAGFNGVTGKKLAIVLGLQSVCPTVINKKKHSQQYILAFMLTCNIGFWFQIHRSFNSENIKKKLK